MVVHGGHTWRRPGGLDRIGLGKKIKGSLSLFLSLSLGARGLRACSARGHGKPKHSRNAETKPAYDRRCYTPYTLALRNSASRITSTKLPARPPKPLTKKQTSRNQSPQAMCSPCFCELICSALSPKSHLQPAPPPGRRCVTHPLSSPRFSLPRRKRGKGLRHRGTRGGIIACCCGEGQANSCFFLILLQESACISPANDGGVRHAADSRYPKCVSLLVF